MLLFLLRHDVPRTRALGLEKEPVVGRKVAAIQNCDVTRTFFFSLWKYLVGQGV